MTTYRIGEVAERTGVPATTLRYYEDIGLITTSRSDNGYRAYGERDLTRLRFIHRARQLNLGLDDLRELVGIWDGDDCSSVQHRMAEVVAGGLRQTQQQSAETTALAAQLQRVAARLAEAPAAGPCGADCPCMATVAPLPALTCTLDPDAMPGRVQDWQRVLASATSRRVIDGGVALTFPSEPSLAGELAALAAAEHACCSFLAFTLQISADGTELQVRTPPEAAELVTALFGA